MSDTLEEEYWMTLAGQRMSVGEMSEKHVRNALRMLIRKHRMHQIVKDVADKLAADPVPFFDAPDLSRNP